MPSESLLKQYLASSYRVIDGEAEVVLHVGVRSEELAALHRSHGVASSAFITAWNPGSEPLAREINDARNEALAREVAARGFASLEGVGHSPDRDWCEESHLILGIDRNAALELARKYGQVAFLHAGVEGVPELVLCAEEVE
jgi:hypothetical protein